MLRHCKTRSHTIQQGLAAIEFLIGGVIILLVIMGMMQILWAYKAAIQLQQATFEAARAGIVNGGSKASIRQGFIRNAVDFHGGGQTNEQIAGSYAKAHQAVELPLVSGGAGFELRILNPSLEAFDDWGNTDRDNKRSISNTWLDMKPTTIGAESGLSIQDANILKIEITYGFPLIMPVIDQVIATAMQALDPDHIQYYQSTPVRLPMTFTAVMHMQTDVVEDGNESRHNQ